jgi:hypothetical protein
MRASFETRTKQDDLPRLSNPLMLPTQSFEPIWPRRKVSFEIANVVPPNVMATVTLESQGTDLHAN